MADLAIRIPITKIDEAKRLVYGIATGETEDASGEVCHYETTKPLYEKWSENISKSTEGKSLGNLRSMHGNIAAGKVTQITFNDDAKQIEICAKVVDDVEWKKVQEGVYTGFSQGGSYVKRWKDEDTGLQMYTADPHEVSLVDLPCLPTATFSVIKSDGSQELRKFNLKEAASVPSPEEIAVKAVEFAHADGNNDWPNYVEKARAELAKESSFNPAASGPNGQAIGATSGLAAHELVGTHETSMDTQAEPIDTKSMVAHSDALIEDAESLEDLAVSGNDEDVKAHKVPDPKAGIKPHVTEPEVKAPPKKIFIPPVEEDTVPLVKAKDPEPEKVMTEPTDSPTVITKGLKQVWVPETSDVGHIKKADAAKELEFASDAATRALGRFADTMAEVKKKAFTAAERQKDAQSGAAQADGSFPIGNAQDLRNAIHDYGRAKNKPATKAHIIDRAKALKLTDELPKGWEGSTKKFTFVQKSSLEKGLPTCARLALLIEELNYVKTAVHIEEKQEGDDSPLPVMLHNNIDDLCATLNLMVSEETHELLNGQDVDELCMVDNDVFCNFVRLPENEYVLMKGLLPRQMSDKLIESRMLNKIAKMQADAAKPKPEDMAKAMLAEQQKNDSLLAKINEMQAELASVLDAVKVIADQPVTMQFAGTHTAEKDDATKAEEARMSAYFEQMKRDPNFGFLEAAKYAKPIAADRVGG